MRRFVLFTMLLFAIVVGVLGAYFFERSTSAEPVGQLSSPKVDESKSLTRAKTNLAEQQAAKNATAGMQRQFETAANYAAFIQDAMQRPTEGGRFYALIAFFRCQEVSASRLNLNDAIASMKPERENALRVVTNLKERCAGVAGQFLRDAVFLKAIQESNTKGLPDTLLIERGVLAPTNRKTAPIDIRKALGSDSPYLIAATLEANIDHYAESLSPLFANGQNRSLLYLASAAASCEIVGDCKSSFWLMAPCALEGDCEHADLREYLGAGLDPDSRKIYDDVRSKIVAISKTRQVPI